MASTPSGHLVTPSRTKKHAPKVRTGCTVCKKRHVRCDESKPSCQKCTSTGRKCDGYVLIKPLLFEIAEDKDERWAFHYYRNRTSKQISSFAQHRFWNDFVIRAAYSQSAVRHMLAAIAAFQESVDNADDLRRLNCETFCLYQYHKSISRTLEARPDIEDILLAAILFAFWESIQGRLMNSLLHLRSGRQIVAEWQSLGSESDLARSLVIDQLASILERMYVNSAAAWIIHPSYADNALAEGPTQLRSLKDCHDCFFRITSEISCRLSQALGHLSWPQCDPTMVAYGEELISWWSGRFVEFLLGCQADCECFEVNHHAIGVLWLRMQRQAALIRLQSKTLRSEMVYDDFLPQFAELLQTLEDFITSIKDIDKADLDACLGFETNYMKLTAFLIFHCRDPGIRQRTLELVRTTPRLEGIWTNTTAADMITGMFELNYDNLDPELIKIKTIRAGVDPAMQDIEVIWLDRRSGKLAMTTLSDDAIGPFAQAVSTDTKIWQNICGGKAAALMERLGAAHICGRVERGRVEAQLTCSCARNESKINSQQIALPTRRRTDLKRTTQDDGLREIASDTTTKRSDKRVLHAIDG
ncbi:hypothetical protein H2200_008331 [Cladophialophora chaetospira]|uniref:Zn(2)-C6 fungal-type domain-containing protein n=1 Tax=Cladophialophora chaetospira TaxID=386627 RepID=A0AA38X5K4_9EURO|nr:hypothetical protein H2200_008331 [Cladophialophora chaetospira]